MVDRNRKGNRLELLADVCEMYFIEGMTQAQIAKRIGLTRSMVSRMLSEARERKIIDFRIHRPIQLDKDLGGSIVKQYNLNSAYVLVLQSWNDERLLEKLGAVGALALRNLLKPGIKLGIAWGTAVSATVESLEVNEPTPVKIIQLAGALGARNNEYDGNRLAQRLEQKLDGEIFYMNAPYMVDSTDTVNSLLDNESIRETMDLAKQCDTAVVGVGSTDPEHSSFYIAGYTHHDEFMTLKAAGAVGDVCGRHFDLSGNPVEIEFHNRVVSIKLEDFLSIPLRIGVSGGPGKVKPILGALLGGYINILVTDNFVAKQLIELVRK
jgi:DNA-binding transcriptional regulator LsrR (DeoR family)